MKIKTNFSQDDIEKIKQQRFLHPDPKIQLRMEALFLKNQGLPHEQVCHMLGIHITTLSRWLRAYREGGLENIMTLNYGNRESDMESHRITILEYFVKNPPSTIAEAVAKIEKLTGIRRSGTQVSKFLKSMGFKLRKTGGVPGKVKPEEQETFKKKLWILS